MAKVKQDEETLTVCYFYLASGILYPEAMNSRSSDLNMSVAKYRVARNRFLLSLQKEDLIIQTLQRKAQ